MADDRSKAVLRWWRRALITVTAAGAVVASFVFLTDLAIHAGWPPHYAWLLPLCVDALAAMALTQYRLTGSKSAGVIAVLAIVFSAIGNAASHWFTTGLLDDGWTVEPLLTPQGIAVTIVGAVPAVALGLCVHLVTQESAWASPRNHPDTAEETAPGGLVSVSSSVTPREPRRPVSSAAGAASHPTSNTSPPVPKPSAPSRSQRRTDTELVSLVLQNSWRDESLDSLTSLLSVSKSRASRVRRQAQAVSASTSPNGQPSNPDLIDSRA